MTAFEVIADPSRREMLSCLRAGEHSVNELVTKTGMSQPLVSKHLKTLRDAGMARARVDGQRRLYQLEPKAFQEIEAWYEPFRRYWSGKMNDLERHLENMND